MHKIEIASGMMQSRKKNIPTFLFSE